MFLRGHGIQSFTQQNGYSRKNNVPGEIVPTISATAHKSGELGQIQGDGMRNVTGRIGYSNTALFGNFDRGVYESMGPTRVPPDAAANPNTAGGVIHGTARIEALPQFAGNLWSLYMYPNDYTPSLYFRISRQVPVANEIRPANMAVKYVIKVK